MASDRSTLLALIASLIDSNGSGGVTALDERTVLNEIIDSITIFLDDPFLRIVSTTSGTQPDYVVTLTDQYPDDYSNVIPIMFKAHATSTGAATFKVNSLTAKNLRRPDGSATEAGDIVLGRWYMVNYVSGDDEFLVFEGFAGGAVIPGGSGLTGSTGSTDNAILRADGTGGSTLQASALVINDIASNNTIIRTTTSDGSDNQSVVITGGGSGGITRGAYWSVAGNEHATTPGWASIGAGDEGYIKFYSATGGSQSLSAEVGPDGNWDFKNHSLSKASRIGGQSQSADPSDPSNGNYVIWQSDGTGSGDDGDIMMKITNSGGTTKTITLVDFSAF